MLATLGERVLLPRVVALGVVLRFIALLRRAKFRCEARRLAISLPYGRWARQRR
jgi:hypothetical protein